MPSQLFLPLNPCKPRKPVDRGRFGWRVNELAPKLSTTPHKLREMVRAYEDGDEAALPDGWQVLHLTDKRGLRVLVPPKYWRE